MSDWDEKRGLVDASLELVRTDIRYAKAGIGIALPTVLEHWLNAAEECIKLIELLLVRLDEEHTKQVPNVAPSGCRWQTGVGTFCGVCARCREEDDCETPGTPEGL